MLPDVVGPWLGFASWLGLVVVAWHRVRSYRA
jgi:hypothetical protein